MAIVLLVGLYWLKQEIILVRIGEVLGGGMSLFEGLQGETYTQ